MNNTQLINQDSGNFEYYTPIEIVEAAKKVMGSIDLDPASSKEANKNIKATRIFTKEDNGLLRPWDGNIWLNHPFSRENNPRWIHKLMTEYYRLNIKQACCITYAATSEKWLQPLLDYPQCFLIPRTNYYLPDGTKKTGVTKGSVVTYLGLAFNTAKFNEVFSSLGTIKVKYEKI